MTPERTTAQGLLRFLVDLHPRGASEAQMLDELGLNGLRGKDTVREAMEYLRAHELADWNRGFAFASAPAANAVRLIGEADA